MELVWNLLTGIASVAATTVGVTSYLNSRFTSTAIQLTELRGEIAVLREQVDNLAYRITANTELIAHRTERLQTQDKNQLTLIEGNAEKTQAVVDNLILRFERKIDDLDNRVRDLEQFQGQFGFRIRGQG